VLLIRFLVLEAMKKMPQAFSIHRSLSSAIGFCIALGIGCHPIVRPPLSEAPQLVSGRSAQLLTTQIIVWNRIAQPVRIEIVLDDSVVYSGSIEVPKIAEQIGGGRIVQITQGKHKLQARDVTRGLVQNTVFSSDPAQAAASQVITVRIEPSGPHITIGREISP
jgi:hypothetical protein